MTDPWKDNRLAANDRPISENFEAWHGRSKVVNDDGTPKVVFHGTPSNFDQFKQGVGLYGRGIYFSCSAGVASDYATGAMGARVMPVYLKVENPYFAAPQEDIDSDDLIRKGFDGIFYDDKLADGDGPTWIVFKTSQIKSAIGNTGLYLEHSDSLTDHAQEEALLRAKRASALVGAVALAGMRRRSEP